MFPRSAGTDPARSATFAEAAARLPYIAAMGFDVVYLPAHPSDRPQLPQGPQQLARHADPAIRAAHGRSAPRKAATRRSSRGSARSTISIASSRRRGTTASRSRSTSRSRRRPIIPTSREHPEWFRHRPDGTIKYAENPPKKYQDIYPFDFESEDWQALWHGAERGDRVLDRPRRHDLPRRQPAHQAVRVLGVGARRDQRAAHPETIFLSEAFTRPKIMRYLAKIGFSQSYTYFTWRNTAEELSEYFTELTQTDVREYMRPNLFANTPDILHEYLQHGGRPAFQVRLVLAATLGASYGIYSGFELCENVPVKPGSEEYLDSEKYQIRAAQLRSARQPV